ncbi:PD-(D/E)XK nuclease superfamily protein [Ulvibacter sp. MAR_2010_11]|uniref:PD-(D/E)XK nuclease family protein n=1 Tax=Ulvibacter sp. MAR_2010_11 TaxID=1250229 RepID=UPI000C2B65BE|nr:PD-(D/E)XK nuclease family protein [Ulvibacter sp. MAR_2010_11]PKA83000.1 PD-(D/E)XK nuclease superfamily protein [Ulvibacter sp. MAR_2010_11]
MQTFLEETLHTLKNKHGNLAELILVLPSKRAGGFLKNYLRNSAVKTEFAPTIISIEEFIETLSDLRIISSTELLFKSYDAYLKTEGISEKESFETYTSWATTLLNDFNEIDRYLVEPKAFFSYLGSIKTLEKWNVQDEKTPLIEGYLHFWSQLPLFYETLKELLLHEDSGYQGLVYRKASEDIEHYIHQHGAKRHVFIGFNALNNAEQHIIQELLETGNTEVFWDTDTRFYKDIKHSASLFLRQYQKEWKSFEHTSFQQNANNFKTEKKFTFVEVQKNMGQVKYLANLLSGYTPEQLNKTAVVLADEALLLPVINSLPKTVSQANITMGIPLKSFPTAVFFETLLHFHLKEVEAIYYKDVLTLLNHPVASHLLEYPQEIIAKITQQNTAYTSLEQLQSWGGVKNEAIIALLFSTWNNESAKALQSCIQLILTAKNQFQEQALDRVVLYKLFTVFEEIEALNANFPHSKTIKTVHSLFVELIATTSLDFEGDAYEGLQIMGVLETRVLDFENIIMLSVNEGILPSGKSNASFITYDLKQQFGLPSYTEKDAIYTYHFYRLLHRTSQATFMYNSHADGLNSGEKSRFLLQLEVEKQTNHIIEKVVVNPPVYLEPKTPRSIAKTPAVMERLQEIAQKGFSPSALTSYIRNPIDFYYQKILKINEFQEVEETVAYNTLGTIVHDSLQELYEPWERSFLNVEMLQKAKSQIDTVVTKQFKRTFKEGNFSRGKNLIIFEVAKRYISNFINLEISEISAGNTIKIIQIETDLKVEIPIEGLSFPVAIGGKVDRVDEYNGVLRIVDYKTGMVQQGELEIVDWNLIAEEYKYSKAFQVLAYALMMNGSVPIVSAEAGIISFKNLNNGFLKFGTKEKPGSRTKDQLVTQATLDSFTEELKKLLLEICNPTIPFTEKEIE